MTRLKGEGITVQCIGCKARKLVPLARAAEPDSPVCENCLLPMLATEAKARAS